MLAHSSERVNSDSGCFESADTQTEAQYSYYLPQKYRKRSIPRTEEVGDMKTAEHKSESRNNHQFAAGVQDLTIQVDITRVKAKLHRMRRKNSWKFSEPSQKPKVIYIDDFCEFGNYCKELSWNHRTAISHRLETRNCRTSCTSNKRRDISRIIAIWID